MMTTVVFPNSPPQSPSQPRPDTDVLVAHYEEIAWTEDIRWVTRYRKERLLGSGGQGAVYLAQRLGADGFVHFVALKVFSPEAYRDRVAYHDDMIKVGKVAARIAQVQCDSVVNIHDFIELNDIRLMEMEWLDGFDLHEVLSVAMLNRTREKVTPERWQYVSRVILSEGPTQARLKPGIAIAVLRDCLAGLTALHREGIVHGDLKPANIVLKRSGNAKLIDIGSAIDLRGPSPRRMWSPTYAAPEVLQGSENTPRSDLASLGYVLVEMLAGQRPFAGLSTFKELIDAKAVLDKRLTELLPPEVSGNELLLNLCQRLIAPDPSRRFASAQAADVGRKGAADFHRQLVKGDLASEYEHELRAWLEQIG